MTLLARTLDATRRLLARRARVVGINRRNLTLVYPNNPRQHYPYADDKLLAKECFERAIHLLLGAAETAADAVGLVAAS